ncbi:thioesterase [Thauera propionica]|uniref:Thioesterase n=1 Tax=Thauera propionica TaxID=2019431 RepID=A0A235F3I5_9RHOO|nr:thioesterase family protein [Thauera propionica]OYD55814.1 thioesterase [Thauera propionica]
MARVRIELPDRFPFRTAIALLISHINYGRHLDNAQLLGLVSEGRVRFLKSMGYTELDIEGVGIVVADAAVQYRSEAFHGETMVVEMAADDFSEFGCDLVWRLTDEASGREVARGKTGIVFFDYGERRKTAVPEGFRRRFAPAS